MYRDRFQAITPKKNPKTNTNKKQWWQNKNFLNFTFNSTGKFLRKKYFSFPQKEKSKSYKNFIFAVEKKRRNFFSCCFWQKIVIMYDNNILTFLAFYSVPAIGAEVSDLMILMVGRKKVRVCFSAFSGFKATLETVFLLTFVNFKTPFSSFIFVGEILGKVLEKQKFSFHFWKMPVFVENRSCMKVSQSVVDMRWRQRLIFFSPFFSEVSELLLCLLVGNHDSIFRLLDVQELWNLRKSL